MDEQEVPSVEEQDEEGVYFEEVEMIVDNLIDKIIAGEIQSKDKCGLELEEDVGLASHINDDDLCMRVLKWSKHPTAYFFNNGRSSGEDMDYRLRFIRDDDQLGLPWDAGKKAFPWRLFAVDAMEGDVKDMMCDREQFKSLPQWEPGEDD